MWRFLILLCASPAWADSVVATRSIPPGAVISAEDVTLVAMEIPDALNALKDAIGQIAPSGLNAGRVVQADQITPQLRVQRNAIVALTLRSGGLEIQTEGRALAEGGVGDVIDIMNLSSRTRISGRINSDGSVLVTAGTSLE
jgi:flagella basal body P-ring formation protein FlgA